MHERLDGSGYPKRLRGDEIQMESRILAIADVVEAMCSVRAYRPARGLEAALDEKSNPVAANCMMPTWSMRASKYSVIPSRNGRSNQLCSLDPRVWYDSPYHNPLKLLNLFGCRFLM